MLKKSRQVDRYKLGVQGVICAGDLHLGVLSEYDI